MAITPASCSPNNCTRLYHGLVGFSIKVGSTYQDLFQLLGPFDKITIYRVVRICICFSIWMWLYLPSTFFLRWTLGQLCHNVPSPCRGSVGTPGNIEEINTGVLKPFDDDTHLCKARSAFDNYTKQGQLIWLTGLFWIGNIQSWQFNLAAMTNLFEGNFALMALTISRINRARFSRLPPY